MTLEQLELVTLLATCGTVATVFVVGLIADTISRRREEKRSVALWAARSARAARRLS